MLDLGYNIYGVEEEIEINTVIEMDSSLMSERKINDLVTTIFDAEHLLQSMNAKALEIIKKHANTAKNDEQALCLPIGGSTAPHADRDASYF